MSPDMEDVPRMRSTSFEKQSAKLEDFADDVAEWARARVSPAESGAVATSTHGDLDSSNFLTGLSYQKAPPRPESARWIPGSFRIVDFEF